MPLSNEASLDVIRTNAIQSIFGTPHYFADYDVDRIDEPGLMGWAKTVARKLSWADASGQKIEKLTGVKRKLQLQKQWREHVCNTGSPTNDDALFETFELVTSLVSEAGANELDLTGLAAENVSGEHLVATLRASYLERAEVRGWGEALGVAARALALAGLVAEDHLEGLA